MHLPVSVQEGPSIRDPALRSPATFLASRSSTLQQPLGLPTVPPQTPKWPQRVAIRPQSTPTQPWHPGRPQPKIPLQPVRPAPPWIRWCPEATQRGRSLLRATPDPGAGARMTGSFLLLYRTELPQHLRPQAVNFWTASATTRRCAHASRPQPPTPRDRTRPFRSGPRSGPPLHRKDSGLRPAARRGRQQSEAHLVGHDVLTVYQGQRHATWWRTQNVASRFGAPDNKQSSPKYRHDFQPNRKNNHLQRTKMPTSSSSPFFFCRLKLVSDLFF